jgi:hypothetical protein
MENYKLNRIQDTDIFFLAKGNIELLGENLITGSFQEVLGLASTLRNDANDIGTGDLVAITDAKIELTSIINAKWYLLAMTDRFQIVRTDGLTPYSLPTNILAGSGQGSLENIFNRIIQIVTT